MKIRNLLEASAVVAGLILAGCVSTNHSNGASTDRSEILLNGTGWLLKSLNQQSVALGTEVTLNFERGTLNGSEGCNQYKVSSTADGDKIAVRDKIAATRRACEGPIMAQASAYSVNGRQLKLFDADGKVLAAFERQSPVLPGKNSQNGTYVIDGLAITLTDGVAETEQAPGSASKRLTRYFGNAVEIDLNGDGATDSAFLLVQDSGGSGTFYFVAAALNTPDGYVGSNAILIGDRVAPQNTIRDPGNPLQFIVNYVDRKADEAMTVQPSLGVSKTFKLEDKVLVEVSLRKP